MPSIFRSFCRFERKNVAHEELDLRQHAQLLSGAVAGAFIGARKNPLGGQLPKGELSPVVSRI